MSVDPVPRRLADPTGLVQSLEILTRAVGELAKSASELRTQTEAENIILRRRTAYFKILIVLMAVLTAAFIFNGVQQHASDAYRAEQLRIVKIAQECQVQVRFSPAATAAQAVVVYRACVNASK